MPVASIEVCDLTKVYGSTPALRGISFECFSGQVVGFVGPNGAGKSTTLRIAAGLATATSGSIEFGGSALNSFAAPGRTVGFCLDASAFHPGRSVKETLIIGSMVNGVKRARAEQLMHQGVRWVRDLVKKHADDGGTVLLSSHLLKEVESIADDVVIIDRGVIVIQGPPRDLGGAMGAFVIPVDIEAFHDALAVADFAAEAKGEGFLLDAPPEVVSEWALEMKLVLRHLSKEESSLEDTFVRMTRGEYAANPARSELDASGVDK